MRIDTGTVFHRALAVGRDLGRRSTQVFEAAIDAGRCSLDDVLAFEYREIKGHEIRSLSHLFDVRRVPPSGFTPPKYHTRYDARVDVALQTVMDESKAREPALIFALVIDLNFNPVIGASIGISIFPKDGTTADALVKSADTAMYRSKKEKTGFSFAT